MERSVMVPTFNLHLGLDEAHKRPGTNVTLKDPGSCEPALKVLDPPRHFLEADALTCLGRPHYVE